MIKDGVNLPVDVEGLNKFCSKLIKRSRDIAKTYDALVTLESFIFLFGKSAHGTKEFQAIDQVIKSYTEQTRERLLDLRTKELLADILRIDNRSMRDMLKKLFLTL